MELWLNGGIKLAAYVDVLSTVFFLFCYGRMMLGSWADALPAVVRVTLVLVSLGASGGQADTTSTGKAWGQGIHGNRGLLPNNHTFYVES